MPLGGRGLTAVPARRAWAGCAALTVLAFVLCAAQIDQSLFGDELFLHAIVTRDGLGDVVSEVHDTESTPPLHFVLAWLSVVCALLFAVVLLVLSALPVMLMSFSATSCRSLPAVSRAPVLLMS